GLLGASAQVHRLRVVQAQVLELVFGQRPRARPPVVGRRVERVVAAPAVPPLPVVARPPEIHRPAAGQERLRGEVGAVAARAGRVHVGKPRVGVVPVPQGVGHRPLAVVGRPPLHGSRLLSFAAFIIWRTPCRGAGGASGPPGGPCYRENGTAQDGGARERGERHG